MWVAASTRSLATMGAAHRMAAVTTRVVAMRRVCFCLCYKRSQARRIA